MYSFRHVAISVSDVDQSIAFYHHLGFEPWRDYQADDGSLAITHLRNGHMVLELFQYKNSQPAPDFIHDTDTDLPVIGTKHFGLGVDSLEEARADLTAKGLADRLGPSKPARTGPMSYFFVTDPDGILVEIWGDEQAKP
ncbi:MAG: glyoxylase family protein [Candidatus Saccharibacteria bacterium]|jgi:glyoxylase I family protein|nr:glyoxylase family protein [Candidatus Saccharibacteria bacterium]